MYTSQPLVRLAGAFLVMLALSAPAHAQMLQWEDRIYVNVSVGGQNGVKDIDQVIEFPLHQETASLVAPHEIGNGPTGDISAGYRLMGNYAIGVAFSRFSRSYSISATGFLPHPLIRNQPRLTAAIVDDVVHTENVLHVQASYMIPLSDRIDLLVFGGPSVFSLKQDLVTGVSLGPEVPPYNPNVTDLPLGESSSTAIGYNFGADWTYLLWPTPRGSRPATGVGILLRYARASTDLDADGISAGSGDLGGLTLGAGLRFRWR